MSHKDWLKEWTPHESRNFITEFALLHCQKGGAQGKHIADCIISGDFLSVCNYDLDSETATAYEYANCRQAIGFFAKASFVDLGCDRRAVAESGFWESERECELTNEIFRGFASGNFSMLPDVSAITHRAIRKIALVLGDLPKFEEMHFHFGPGATTLTKKRFANAAEKLSAGISCSEDLLPYAPRILEELPHVANLHSSGVKSLGEDSIYESQLVNVVLTNDRLDFVPKNAKTDRGITVGGSLNTMVQLALGEHMRNRMLAFGIDLSDQSKNQKLAKEGSLSGCYATLDLKAASDTISTEVVFSLLPIDWALALDVSRSAKVDYKGRTHRLEKFSSMGNGFTFPLESLIFWALSSSASEDGFASVYGDDIIVRTSDVPAVKNVLHVYGFTLNMSKSYWSGPFRESCGADFIRGFPVRPFYQKDLVSQSSLFRLHNYYVRNGNSDFALKVKAFIEESLILYGPDGYGDGHLLGDWLPQRHKRCDSHGYGGVTFFTYKHAARFDYRSVHKSESVIPLYEIYRKPRIKPSRHRPLPFVGLFGLSRFTESRVGFEPIPERVSPVTNLPVKVHTFTGTEGYKKVRIYTFAIND